jgi:hypothetical protein
MPQEFVFWVAQRFQRCDNSREQAFEACVEGKHWNSKL